MLKLTIKLIRKENKFFVDWVFELETERKQTKGNPRILHAKL